MKKFVKENWELVGMELVGWLVLAGIVYGYLNYRGNIPWNAWMVLILPLFAILRPVPNIIKWRKQNAGI